MVCKAPHAGVQRTTRTGSNHGRFRFSGQMSCLLGLVMVVRFNSEDSASEKVPASNRSRAKKTGHTRPRPPLTDIGGPGRQRVANWLALLNVSHSTFCSRVKNKVYPQPDGHDGRFPWWHNETVRNFLGK